MALYRLVETEDNPYAVGDREMIRTDNGRYMNIIGITGTLLHAPSAGHKE